MHWRDPRQCRPRCRPLRRPAERAQVPALALSCPIQLVLPVAYLRGELILCAKTTICVRRDIGRLANARSRYEKRSNKRDRSDRSWDMP